jgi:hypothetical protein
VRASAGGTPAFDSTASASSRCWALSAQQLLRLRRVDGLPQVPPHVASLSGDKHTALDFARMMARPEVAAPWQMSRKAANGASVPARAFVAPFLRAVASG